MSLPKVHPELQGLNFWIDELGRVKGNVSIDILNQFVRKHVSDKKLLVRDGPWKDSVLPPTLSEEQGFVAEMNQQDDLIQADGELSENSIQSFLHSSQSFSIMATDAKAAIKSKIGKTKNIISTPSEPSMGAQPDDNMKDENEQSEGRQGKAVTSQIPEQQNAPQPTNQGEMKVIPGNIPPPTGGRKGPAGGPELHYIVYNGELHSLRPDEFSALVENDIENGMRGRRVLKHNPTNVHKTGEGLRSNEDRRPLFYVVDGKLVKQPTTAIPEKAATVKGEKAAKVAKGTGPNIIYIEDRRYMEKLGGSHLYSLNAVQFADVLADPTKLNGHKILKHLPTCVSKDKDGFLRSSESGTRPMYRFQEADGEQGFAEDAIIPVDVVETPGEDLDNQGEEAMASQNEGQGNDQDQQINS